jgi:Putative metal-binding domain of cation transport ATPase
MSDDVKGCDLCGLPVELDAFELKTKEGEKHFCCEGCKGIFQMLHEDEVLAETADQQQAH